VDLENSKGGAVLGIHFHLEIQFWFGETIAHGVQGGLWTRLGYGMDHMDRHVDRTRVLISSINVVLPKRK